MSQHDIQLSVVVEIEDPAWCRDLVQIGQVAERSLHAAWLQIGPQLGQLAGMASEVSVLLSDNDRSAALNAAHRGQSGPTNVLAFPILHETELRNLQQSAGAGEAEPHRVMLGDVVLARETVLREAVEQDVVLAHHVAHLLIHGFLHLLGFDHSTDEEAVVMEALEIRILKKMDISDPYAVV